MQFMWHSEYIKDIGKLSDT